MGKLFQLSGSAIGITARITVFSALLFFLLTTVASATPTVTFADPSNGAAGVSPGALIQATFSEVMDPMSINRQTLTVKKAVKIKAVAAGWRHSIALKTDGTVAVWGFDGTDVTSNLGYGSMAPPAGLKDVIAVAAGYQHCAALKSDGTVVTWGTNNPGPVPAGLTGVTAISAGTGFTMALRSDGTVTTWGSQWASVPVPPAGLTDVAAIAASASSGVALKKDGTLVAMSGGPRPPAGTFSAVAAGGGRFLALKCDGTVVAWGSSSTVPAGLTGVVAIAAGVSGDHAVALKNDGTVVAWGSNTYSQATVPPGVDSVRAIAAGGAHTLAIKADGTVTGWGDNVYSQSTAPDQASKLVAATETFLAIKEDGSLVGWGYDWSGAGAPPAGLTGVVSMAATQGYGLALKNDGTVVGWGSSSSNYPIPSGLSGITAIAVGYFGFAVKNDGTVVAWGQPSWDYYGALKVPAGLSGVTAVATLAGHALALKSDGTVVAWGDNRKGQCNVPAGLDNVVAIAAGSYHSVALKKDGTVVAWGDNSNGAISVPAGLAGVVEIAAGAFDTSVLKGDGTILSWGLPFMGLSLKRPATLDSVAKLSVRGAAAIKSDGGALNWGYPTGSQTPWRYRFGSIYESPVSGTVTYDPVMHTATFIPSAPLDPALYTAEIGSARSATGARLLSPARWTFSTTGYDPSANPVFNHPGAQFCAPATYKIVGSVAAGSGTISCTSPVDSGADATCTVTPSGGFQLASLLDNNVDVTTQVAGTSYVIRQVKADHNVISSFRDVEKPAVAPPPDKAVEATGPLTFVEIGSATATDNVAVISLTNDAPAQMLFPLGITLVAWTAKDAAGNTGIASPQKVTVTDTTPPVLKGLVNQVLEATSPQGAPAYFEVTAVDLVDQHPTVSCSSASGSVFPVGKTTVVTCTAKDAYNNSATGSFTIKVQDTTPPVLNVPADITVILNTPGTAPEVVSFLSAATATDIVDLSVDIAHTATTLDSVGPKTITFTAVDDYGNRTVRTATINVVYGCADSAFLEPVSLLKPFKQGSSIPVKLRVCDASGADVFTANPKLYLQPVVKGQNVGSPIEAASTTPANIGNLFRIAGNKYLYNLDTNPLAPGGYQIRAVLDDGSVRTLPLELKR